MKQALILHGTDAAPDQNWFPWLKAKLEAADYNVWVPLLPENHTPNRQTYGDFLFGSDFDFADSIIIGHSSGAVEVLNLLGDERLPRVKLAVAVSAWAGEKPNGYDTNEQFINLFPPNPPAGFDFPAMKQRADKILFMHGADDPYCPLDRAQYLADQLAAPITIIPNGHHLGAKYTELPELWELIEPNL
jgi:predicted alpha/beta hydrolase family esterase